jgi:hypothetical protein
VKAIYTVAWVVEEDDDMLYEYCELGGSSGPKRE